MMTIERAAQVLRKYNAWRRNTHQPCDPPYTAKAIGEAIDRAIELLEDNIPKANIEDIIKLVENETRVTDEEMCGRGRHRETTEARAMVTWLAYRFTGMTLTAIGSRLNRDHATAVHYNKMISGWLEEPRRNLRGSRIMTKLIGKLEDERETNTDNLSRPA